MTERALLAQVEEAPGDAAPISVYADWLEEHGEAVRAQFLRLQQHLRGMPLSHPKLLERGRALHALGKTLPRRWVDAVTFPRLAGTTWSGADDHGSWTCRFRADGRLAYAQPAGTYDNGTWEQVGVTIVMETNARYAAYFGVIVGAALRGVGHNVRGDTWRWKLGCDAQVPVRKAATRKAAPRKRPRIPTRSR